MLYLVRFGGEIATKARHTRRRFQTQLARNIAAALAREGVDGAVDRSWSRFYVRSEDPRTADVLARVFGIQSYSPVVTRPAGDLSEVVANGLVLFRDDVAGARYAVRARVVRESGAPGAYGARDVERALGAALGPHGARVDLSNPEVTARVEVRDGTAFFFTMVLPGAGGLPMGVQDRCVALISGGFDSAVAAWMVMRRGVPVDFVFCNLGGDEHLAGVRGVVDVLVDRWAYGSAPRLHILEFGPVVAELQRAARPRYLQVLLKRQMLRVADAVADATGAEGVITGDAIGQVASQTMKNLAAMADACRRPVLRPLLGMDKDDIIRRAEHVGTAALSARIAEHCAIVPRNPATAAKKEAVWAEDARLDPAVLAAAVAQGRTVPLGAAAERIVAAEPVEIDHVPPGARVLDLRSQAAFEAWHLPGAERVELRAALQRLGSFGPGAAYVVACPLGAKSAMLAEALRRQGLEAWSFRGGSRGLMEWAAREGMGDPFAEADLRLS